MDRAVRRAPDACVLSQNSGAVTGTITSIDSEICKGRPCVKRARVMVSVILDNLADGERPEDILKGIPRFDAGGYSGVRRL